MINKVVPMDNSIPLKEVTPHPVANIRQRSFQIQTFFILLGRYSESNYDAYRLLPTISDAINRASLLDTNPADRWPQDIGTRVYLRKPPESGLRNTNVHSVCHPNAGRGGLDLSSLRLIGTGHHLASIHYYRWKRHMKGFSKNGTPYFAHQISNGHCL